MFAISRVVSGEDNNCRWWIVTAAADSSRVSGWGGAC